MSKGSEPPAIENDALSYRKIADSLEPLAQERDEQLGVITKLIHADP